MTDFFTFGGRVPAGLGMILAGVLVASVWGWIDRGLMGLAVLAPVAIVRGEIWRLVTWPFVQGDPLTLLFGGFMLYSFGQQLSYVWSERRLVARFFGTTVGAAALTTLLALVWEPASSPHLGMWPVVNALLFAWAMIHPDRQLNIWGVLPITGKTLALLLVFGTLLYGLASGGISGIGSFAPHLFAIGIAWYQSRGPRGGREWRRVKEWWREREMRRRTRHLKVVGKDGPGERPRWMN